MGSKFVVKRRYSDFYKLRKQLIEFVSWNHCHACDQYFHQIANCPFPRRRLIRSGHQAVIKERMDSLGLFLRYILLCLKTQTFRGCQQAKRNIENCILRSFLEIENKQALFPPQKPLSLEYFNSIDDKKSLTKPARTKRSQSLTTSTTNLEQMRMMGEFKRTTSNYKVATDTCQYCLQKWTECYCNEDTTTYGGGLAGRGSNVERLHETLMNSYQPQGSLGSGAINGMNTDSKISGSITVGISELNLVGADGNVSDDGSDASNCSRCGRDWDSCYCCQQVSRG
jgi:hypothetical protein